MLPRRLAAGIAVMFSLTGCAAKLALNEYGNPVALSPRSTSGSISAADLQTRLYAFADDSMQGRDAGRVGNQRGTGYIARELRQLDIEPAGDSGTYFQALPYVVRRIAPTSTLSVDGRPLRWLEEWAATPPPIPPKPIEAVQAIFGGVRGDTARMLSAAEAAGKFVVLIPGQLPLALAQTDFQALSRAINARLAGAAAVAIADLHNLAPSVRRLAYEDRAGTLPPQTPSAGTVTPPQPFSITAEAAALIFGAPVQELKAGTVGGKLTARLELQETPVPQYARNVIGIIRGSDVTVSGQYVALGAHNDHVGFTGLPLDHDSLKLFNNARTALAIQGNQLRPLTQQQLAAIRLDLDSVRRLRPRRLDSIMNGADDDGSGSMALLEIAEAIAHGPKPRRSILFVWHTGEEDGLQGARWFTDHATVPRDSIVAQINLDMIGRGRATDVPGGGDDYLAVVGSKRLSSELGEIVAEVNRRQPTPLRLDYQFDSPTTWPGYNNIYGRSDHAMYARFNIPIAFFFTGLHGDYHQRTDEPQYIDYPHYARITRYLYDLLLEVANRPNRVRLDSKP
ncbi:MAG TPA: M28 family peptidase [Gemmatimonadales bacterium]|nr:M28 family peptidase [Gemmatimonadales bacterium]